jgi:hypothetical protein
MKKLSLLFALLGVVALVGGASAIDNATSVGPGNGVIVPGTDTNPCPGSTLLLNFDGSGENGVAWQYGGVVPPYYGAFAEGYFGTGTVCGHQLLLTTVSGLYTGQSLDAYVWDSNGSMPNNVLGVTVGMTLGSSPGLWPTITAHDLDSNDVGVGNDWFAGYWGNWPGVSPGWYCAIDTNGFGGMPATNIAPGIGYPTGWNNPSVIWGPIQAMGIGAYLTDGPPNPTTTTSWGAIKALYN